MKDLMNLALYEIDQAILTTIDQGLDEDGCITDEAMQALDSLKVARETKLENCGLVYKSLTAEAKALREEEIALAERRRRKESNAERLKAYINNSLAGEGLETARIKYSYRKSTSVLIDNEDDLPEDYWKIQATPDKTKLRDALKSGVLVPGAELVTNQNLQIK